MDDELPVLDPAADEKEVSHSLSSRALLNILSVGVAAVVLLVSAPWWLGAVHSTWSNLFPPPPYQGPLFYGLDTTGHVLGLRLSDGEVQWQSDVADGTAPLVSGAMIVTYDVVRHRAIGLAARTGKRIWQSAPDTRITDGGLIGITGATVWLDQLTADNTESVVALAVNTGQITGHIAYHSPGQFSGFLQDQHLITVQTQGTAVHVIAYATDALRQQWDAVLPADILNADGIPDLNCFAAARAIVCAVVSASYAGTHMSYGLDAADGHMLWQVRSQGQEIAVTADMLFTEDHFSPSDGESVTMHAYALATGQLRWQHTYFGDSLVLANSAQALPQSFAGGVLLVLTPPGVIGVAPATGAIMWSWAEPHTPTIPTSPLWSNTFADNGTLFVTLHDVVYALDPATGHFIWEILPVSLNATDHTVAHLRQCQFGQATLICTMGATVLALDPATGKVRWLSPQNLSAIQVAISPSHKQAKV